MSLIHHSSVKPAQGYNSCLGATTLHIFLGGGPISLLAIAPTEPAIWAEEVRAEEGVA